MNNNTVRNIRVFIASPNDVYRERDLAENVIHKLNLLIRFPLGIIFECVRWENSSTPQMGRPQKIVLSSANFDAVDIVVGILWKHFGSPTGGNNPTNRRPYLSGTEEEFSTAYASWKRKKSPDIMFYRCVRAPDNMKAVDATQYKRVQGFCSNFGPSGPHPGLLIEYKEPTEFAQRLMEDLLKKAFSLSGIRSLGQYELSPALVREGYTHFFPVEGNSFRDEMKRKAINGSNTIRLIAQSGFSYTAPTGHRFRQQVADMLKRGGTFDLIIQAPWTLTAYSLAVAEGRTGLEALRNKDPVDVISDSIWFRTKWKAAIDGIRGFESEFPQQVRWRHSVFDISATMLICRDEAYFEPYLTINGQQRYAQELLTFETRMQASCELYKHVCMYWDSMWSGGLDDNELERRAESMKALLRQSVKLSGKDGTDFKRVVRRSGWNAAVRELVAKRRTKR